MVINTKDKTVTPQGETLGQIMTEIQAMFPNSWQNYKIAAEITTTKERYPYFPVYPQPEIPAQPFWDYWKITCQDTGTICTGVRIDENSKLVYD
jgi:hypothetical protein